MDLHTPEPTENVDRENRNTCSCGNAGLLVSPDEAATLGLVDEVVPPEGVVDSAIKWCQGLLALPEAAMNTTRRQARADLVSKFARDIDHELAEVGSWWWSQETQSALHRVVDQLTMKKKPSVNGAN
jgi:enoyl-CoA hydratase/carnithine racemase